MLVIDTATKAQIGDCFKPVNQSSDIYMAQIQNKTSNLNYFQNNYVNL